MAFDQTAEENKMHHKWGGGGVKQWLSFKQLMLLSICLPGVIALFCRQYDIIKDNEPNNNKDKAKNSSECSTPEHPQGGLLRSNV